MSFLFQKLMASICFVFDMNVYSCEYGYCINNSYENDFSCQPPTLTKCQNNVLYCCKFTLDPFELICYVTHTHTQKKQQNCFGLIAHLFLIKKARYANSCAWRFPSLLRKVILKSTPLDENSVLWKLLVSCKGFKVYTMHQLKVKIHVYLFMIYCIYFWSHNNVFSWYFFSVFLVITLHLCWQKNWSRIIFKKF